MRNFKFVSMAFMALMMAGSFAACSDENDDPIAPEPEPEVQVEHKYELYVCPVKHGGMSMNKNGTFVRSVKALTADQPTVEFNGKGLEITNKYTMESITKGKFHYQVPESKDRFVKFSIDVDANGNEVVDLVQERPFMNNEFPARKYTHAWLDEGQTLLLMATDGDHKKVFWTKLKESDLSIVAEGVLDLPIPEGFGSLSTSGILTYREKSKELIYFYIGKDKETGGMTDSATSNLFVAVINPSTMAVTSNKAVDSKLAEESAASAYGELMQNTVMYDEDGNLYLAGLVTVDGEECGSLLRMKAGSNEFDSFNAFPNPEGKLLTIQYLADGKALAYSRDNALGTKIDSPSHFYSIIDLATGKRERVKYNGVDLPYCSGRFSQRSVVVDGKAYIGVANKDDLTAGVYIYDIKTGNVEKGVELQSGFCFDIIRVLDVE